MQDYKLGADLEMSLERCKNLLALMSYRESKQQTKLKDQYKIQFSKFLQYYLLP